MYDQRDVLIKRGRFGWTNMPIKTAISVEVIVHFIFAADGCQPAISKTENQFHPVQNWIRG